MKSLVRDKRGQNIGVTQLIVIGLTVLAAVLIGLIYFNIWNPLGENVKILTPEKIESKVVECQGAVALKNTNTYCTHEEINKNVYVNCLDVRVVDGLLAKEVKDVLPCNKDLYGHDSFCEQLVEEGDEDMSKVKVNGDLCV